MEQVSKKGLYDSKVYQACLDRIEKIQPDTQAQWGKMTPAQMLAHCSEIQEVSNGKPLKNTPFIARLFKGMIRKMVVNDKPYSKGTQTHPQYKQRDQKEFETEKQRLLQALQTFVEDPKSSKHPLFGEMSAEERGWAMYKHLNHHLEQFGV